MAERGRLYRWPRNQPFGRIGPEQLRSVLAALRTPLDLEMLEPWQEGD